MFEITINNFRSFRKQKFNFKRINILIGENSGGKSSLLKFLLSLKQTLDVERESNLKLRGDFTDLGNYEEVIFRKKVKLNIEFQFETSDSKWISFYENVISNTKRIEADKKLRSKVLKRVKNSSTSIST